MILKGMQNLINRGKEIVFSFLQSGDIYQITYQNNLINMYRGNLVDGGHSNLYLKVKNKGITKLIGTQSPSVFSINDNQVSYRGTFYEVDYQLDLIISDFGWRYKFRCLNDLNDSIELFYVQDIGLADINAILNSEAYTAQYLDYRFENQILSITQNQGNYQNLKISSSHNIKGFSTDGLDFFGLNYKYNRMADYLYLDLPNRIKQGESAYITLKTSPIKLKSNQEIEFIVSYNDNQVKDKRLPILAKVDKKPFIYQVINGKRVVKPTGFEIFNPEYNDQGQLLSFFTKDHSHVVLQQKELVQERSTGNIILTGNLKSETNISSSTNWMNGIFNSHVVLGNTNFNKFLSVNRNQIVTNSLTGQRIWLKQDDEYKLLNMPSYFQMSFNYSKWFYHLDDDLIEITSYMEYGHLKNHLIFKSHKKIKYDFIVTHQILMNNNEDQADINYDEDFDLIFYPSDNSLLKQVLPNLKFSLESDKYQITKLHEFDLPGIVVMKYYRSDLDLAIEGTYNEFCNCDYESFEDSKADFEKEYLNFTNHLKFEIDNDFNRYNHLLYWYTHNALIHYFQPHGLEQYNGAAWGTRDVLQGPLELFLAFGHFDKAKKIILKVFSNQYQSKNNLMDGNFPQWFMFDEYYQIRASDSHADIIVWPLLALSQYLNYTNDESILEEKVPYVNLETMSFTISSSIKEHLVKLIDNLKRNQIKNTVLPKYGGGDWNDTLQPANKELNERMVSGWTTALLYQALDLLSKNLNHYKTLKLELIDYKEKLKKDYYKYIYYQKAPAGFVIFNEKINLLFHPKEEKIGIKYRLIAYNQAITSNLISKNDLEKINQVIEENLKFPDGYHLMEKPVLYQEGRKTYFQRAETATNFGREIGIMYVHAHIRRIESLLLSNDGKRAYEAFDIVNPIDLKKHLMQAEIRQSNAYFSSSDADFINRFEAQNNYHLLKEKQIKFKGGWRIYSSGPGIYINQLITNFLGIKIYKNSLIIAPILPAELTNLKTSFILNGKKIMIEYLNSDHKSLTLNDKIIKFKVNEFNQKYYEIENIDLAILNKIVVKY